MFYNKVDAKLLPTLKNAIIHLCDIAQGYNNTWPDLIVILGNVLKNKDYSVSVEVYDLIQKIIKRYRTEFKSRALFAEIIKTIDHIAVPLTEDALNCLNPLINNQSSNLTVLYLKMLHRILNIFISLNAQDFPEFFEDNLESWYKIIKATIDFNLNITDNEIHRLFIKVKKIGMKALNFYCEHYYEDFMQYHDNFLASVWNLFNIIKQEQKYEKLIKQLLDYYQTLFRYNRANAFDANTIQHLINNLIIPEMKLTNKELDDYEDNPINFIKVELEEIDMDSSKKIKFFTIFTF
jgi:exportin-2 (importin alpha re-exporter)